MPRIDVYTAPSRPAPVNQPATYTQGGASPAVPLVQQVQHLGTQWATIAGNLQAQADQLDFLQAKANYEAGIANVNLELPRDPEIQDDPKKYEAEFIKRANDVHGVVIGGLKSKEARGMFEAYRQRQFQGEVVQARGDGFRLWDAKLAGQFVFEKDRLAKAAGEAVTPDDFQNNVALFEGLVAGSTILKPAQKEQELQSFKAQVAENNMRAWGDRDPARMRAMAADDTWGDMIPEQKKVAIFEHVETREHVAKMRAAENFREVAKTYVDNLEAQSNFGLLTQTQITRGQKGLDPIHPDPKDWNRLAKLNEEAPGLSANDGTGVRQIAAIRFAYSVIKEPSKADAQNALGELDALVKNGGLSKKAMDEARQASEHIQGRIVAFDAQERAIEGSIRAAGAEQRAKQGFQDSQTAKKVDRALTEFEAQYDRSPLRGIAGKMSEIERNTMRAKLKSLIQNNPDMDVKDAVTQILGTPADQKTKSDKVNPLFAPRK